MNGDTCAAGRFRTVGRLFRRSAAFRAWILSAVFVIPGSLLFTGYVKDDSFIAYRYGRNLINGLGLVFNPGERVEGYTDFLWVVLSSLVHPFDPGDGSVVLLVCRIVGVFSAIALAAAAVMIARHLGAKGTPVKEAAALVAGVVVATHPAVAIWSMSGLEPVAFAALAAWAVERALAGRAVPAMWICAVAVLLRPEGHALMLFCGLYLLAGSGAGRLSESLRRVALASIGPVAVVGAYHLWRFWWFGSLVGNTYRIKSCQGLALYEGFEDTLAAVTQGAGPAIVFLALAALILLRRRDILAVVSFGLFFFAYLWWVGGDEMRYGRLVLSAWPLLAGAAAAVIGMVAEMTASTRSRRIAAFTAVCVLGGAGVAAGGVAQLKLVPELSVYMTRMKSSQKVLGQYLQQRLPSGSFVAYQDMGMCPYFAPDINFLDIIGLVSNEVGDLRDLHGVRMLCTESNDRQQAASDRERFRSGLRDLVFSRNPRAIVLQATLPVERSGEMIRQASSLVASQVLPYCNGSYSSGLAGDPRLVEGYVLDKVIPREPVMLFAVFVRKDISPALENNQ